MFTTRRNVQLLSMSPTWFLDGTFKTAANIFTEVNVGFKQPFIQYVHFEIFKKIAYLCADICYCGSGSQTTCFRRGRTHWDCRASCLRSLKDKTELSYTTILQAVKDFAGTARIPNITPPIVMLDLELALKNGVARVFPNSNVRFCFFFSLGPSSIPPHASWGTSKTV